MLLAHATGSGALPVSWWATAATGVVGLVLLDLWLRTGWALPRLSTPLVAAAPTTTDDRVVGTGGTGGAAGAVRVLTRVVGLGGLVGIVVVALAGPDRGASNLAPTAVLVVWWVGLPLVCLVAGDVMAALDPFGTVADATRALRRGHRGPRDGPRPPARWAGWSAPAMLFAVGWYRLAYHAPDDPRSLAVALAVYTVVATAALTAAGGPTRRDAEAFGALSGAVAAIGVRRRSRHRPACVAALAVVWLGGTVFDALAGRDAWVEVLGTTTGWSRSALDTAGLVATTAAVALVAAVAVLAARVPPGRAGAAPAVGAALVPMAAGWFVAHDVTLLLFEGQNALALVSDPLGRGWDLFGTYDRTVDYGLVDAGWVRAVQVLALAAGHAGAVVVAHDAALRRWPRRAAVRVTAATTSLAATSLTLAAAVVLG